MNMVEQSTILQKHPWLLLFFILAPFIIALGASCGLFDKEIKQDQHITSFRRQLSRVQDSLDNHKGKVKAYKSIIEDIDVDRYLITQRKKNNLLIEANSYLYDEYLKTENYKKAISYSNIMIGIDSTLAKGYYNRGCVYQLMNNDSLAISDYSLAIKLDPDYADAYYNRGILYEEADMYDPALSDYSRAIRLNPPYVSDIYNNRGNVYLAKEVVDKAINDYSKAIQIDSLSLKVYCNRAWAYVVQKEFDKALADCNLAISIDSVNVNAYIKRALVYEGKADYSEAIKDYRKVLKLDPYDKLDTHAVARHAIQKLKPLASRKKQ
ncbi:MAG: tetratricopeptide repeat protein [Dysgonomonas sp.]